jgi:membrane-associated protease RseP (regulator of RpoE activity)
MSEMDEVDYINRVVREYFTVYDAKIYPDHLEFHIISANNKDELYKNFNALWSDLKKQNYVPTLNNVKGDYVLQIVKIPPRKFSSIYINIGLLIATIISTVIVGMQNYAGYFNISNMWAINVFFGGTVFFAVPLMLILGLHEMGHYFAAKKHNVAASLPFFIPAPTIIGTLGAFISLREPIPNKRALLDIGIAGPIVGFLVAIPIAIIGMWLGHIYPHPSVDYSTVMKLQMPILYNFINLFYPFSSTMFPMAFAAWVGFLVTAINLFPIGQLDGGHIAKALLGDYSRYVSYVFIVIMLILGIYYIGWLIFALFVLILGLRHPPSLNEISKIGGKRMVAGALAFVLLVVTFSPVPISEVYLQEQFNINSLTHDYKMVQDVQPQIYPVLDIINTGQKMINVSVYVSNTDHFNIIYKAALHNISMGSTRSLMLNISLTNQSVAGTGYVYVTVTTMLEKVSKTYTLNITVYNQSNYLRWSQNIIYSSVNNSTMLSLTNTGNSTEYIWQINSTESYSVSYYNATIISDRILIPPSSFVLFKFTFYATGKYYLYAIDQNMYVAMLTFYIT